MKTRFQAAPCTSEAPVRPDAEFGPRPRDQSAAFSDGCLTTEIKSYRDSDAPHDRAIDRRGATRSRGGVGAPLSLVWWLFEQRNAAAAYLFCDDIAEQLHDPGQVDLD